MARALHKHSPRASGPFVAINTAAIPKDPAGVRELFGHARRLYRRADHAPAAASEQAEGGTLFLDEIGDMPFDLQTLLWVLSDGHFYCVGNPRSAVKANVRVIAATHRDLEQRVKARSAKTCSPPQRDPPACGLRSAREDAHAGRAASCSKALAAGRSPKRISDARRWRSWVRSASRQRAPAENICHWLTVAALTRVIEAMTCRPRWRFDARGRAPVEGGAGRAGRARRGPLERASPCLRWPCCRQHMRAHPPWWLETGLEAEGGTAGHQPGIRCGTS